MRSSAPTTATPSFCALLFIRSAHFSRAGLPSPRIAHGTASCTGVADSLRPPFSLVLQFFAVNVAVVDARMRALRWRSLFIIVLFFAVIPPFWFFANWRALPRLRVPSAYTLLLTLICMTYCVWRFAVAYVSAWRGARTSSVGLCFIKPLDNISVVRRFFCVRCRAHTTRGLFVPFSPFVWACVRPPAIWSCWSYSLLVVVHRPRTMRRFAVPLWFAPVRHTDDYIAILFMSAYARCRAAAAPAAKTTRTHARGIQCAQQSAHGAQDSILRFNVYVTAYYCHERMPAWQTKHAMVLVPFLRARTPSRVPCAMPRRVPPLLARATSIFVTPLLFFARFARSKPQPSFQQRQPGRRSTLLYLHAATAY